MSSYYKRKNAFEKAYANQQADNPSKWMVTFSDLLSIIITFFVLIYSMSSVVDEDWNVVTQSFVERLNPDHLLDKTTSPQIKQQELTELKIEQAEDLDYLRTLLENDIDRSPTLHKMISLKSDSQSLTIHIAATDVFITGDIDMTRKGSMIVDLITNIVQPIKNRVEIYTYSNNQPLDTLKYPTAWELSLSRGLVIAQILRNKGYTYNMSAFARTHYPTNEQQNDEANSETALQHIEIVIQHDEATN